MAASLLLPSSPYFFNRKDQERFNLHTMGILHVPFQIQYQKRPIKLYVVPRRIISNLRSIRCFTSNSSVELQSSSKEDGVSSGISVSNKSQRSKFHPSSSNSIDAMNDFERQLQEFFDEVKTLVKVGNSEGAIHLLQANYDAVKEQIDAGVKGIEQAAMLDIIALGFMGVGNFEFVEYLLEKLNEIVGNLKNEEPLLDSVLMHMGSMYANLGKFEEAMLVYARGLEILESLFGQNSPYLVTPLLGMAKVYTSIRRALKAVEIYNRAITILETSRGAESEDVVVPLLGLGNLLIKEGKAADAESSFNRILRIYTKLYGENDGRVGVAKCSLAHAMCAKGDVDEAIRLYRNGIQVINDSKYMALDDELVEKMRIDLAELLHVAGREREGRQLLEECLLITEKYKGNEHPSSVTHLINLATSYSRSKNYAEAERLLRTSLQIMRKTGEPSNQSITVPMLHLAVTLYHLKRDEEAERLALEVVRIREEAFGQESILVDADKSATNVAVEYVLSGEALDCLVSIQTRLGKDDAEVLGLLKRVLRIQEKELGYESEEVMVTLKKIVFYLDKMGTKNEKLLLQRRLSMLRIKYKQKVPY
ncbi:Tetratricopeptide repeat-containing domain [Macleaya cordata]|uniref:Tetratricopeptide repeat-containing domain n=1 Tax=Macleaya cordata TaxID=56857 RepID=A0A200QCP5_MACCD|nr:Tetratricopeptide repeat-containing domain [Macleaya cordata]